MKTWTPAPSPRPCSTTCCPDLKNTLLKVRFQVKPPETEEGHALLSQLDQSLAEPLRFPQLERNALLLCDLFTSSAEPSDPIPEVSATCRTISPTPPCA